MSVNALYLKNFNAGDTTTQKWRVAIKTSGAESIFSSLMIIKLNTSELPPITSTSNYMTVFHAGTSSSRGLGIFLKYSSGTYQIGLRYIIKNGSAWNEVPGSFTPLSSWGTVSTDAFMLMLSYDITSNTSPKLIFGVVNFSTITPKTTPDFTLTYTFTSTEITSGAQWGFGSSPESNTAEYGLITTNSYNSYSSSGIYLTDLQGWAAYYMPYTSVLTGVYAMFNTGFSSNSIYSIMRSGSYVPVSTTNLSFQLNTPNTTLSNLNNNNLTPSTSVTLTAGTTSFAVLPSFGVNGTDTNTTYITAVENAITCLLKGTKILTENGYKLIEELTKTDKLITHDKRIIEIKNIFNFLTYPNEETIPFVVKKGKYSAFEDLYLSKGHAIYVDDEFRYPEELDLHKSEGLNHPYSYFHIETENYLKDTIIANGVTVETYTDLFEYQFFNLAPEYKNSKGKRIILT